MKSPRRLRRWWFDLPIRYKGLLVVAIPLVAVAATILLRFSFNRQQQETTVVLHRAATLRDATDALILSLLELETAVGGYVLSRDRSFLLPFERIRTSLPGMGGDDPETTRLLHHELAIAQELVTLTSAGVQPRASEMQQRLRDSKQTMDAIRARVGDLQRELDRTIKTSEAEVARLRSLSTPIILVTFFGGLIGALIAGWLFATGIARRLSVLEQNAVRLATGERLQFATSRGSDEIGSLDKALRRTAIVLRLRARELQSVNRQLEQTVHEQALLNRELEAFSYSVSHDLRAPLRSIDGFAQALREDWGDRLDEAGQNHLARVRNAAQRMGRLIDDLLKLSKLTRAQLQRMEVDLSRMAQEVATELAERNPTRRVTWEFEPGLRAWCDPALVRIVLENLLGNAWKFTSKTEDARIEFRAVPNTAPTQFVIRDNGAGFDMKYVDKLFSPFQRLHAEREFPGTGIGLATIQRIVHKHGGTIRTHGEVGAGATFYFTLEAAEPSSAVA